MFRLSLSRLSLVWILFLSPGASNAGAPGDDDLQCTTPYFFAAAKNDVSRLKALLAQGTDVNDVSSVGFTALICAADAGAIDSVKLLLERGANPNSCTFEQHLCPLWYAAMKNHGDIAGLLIEKGAKLEELNGWGGSTVLAWAVRTGKTEAARVLVAKGASLIPVIKKEYYGGKTALQLAKKDGHLAVVNLIEAAANKPSEPTR